MGRHDIPLMKTFIFIPIFLTINSSFDHSTQVEGQITCDAACQRGIDDAYSHATSIHTDLTKEDDRIINRLNKLENEEVGVRSEINKLAARVTKIENDLKKQDTANLRKYVDDELIIVFREIDSLDTRLTGKINKLNSTIRADGGGSHDNLHDLTEKVHTLESDNEKFWYNWRTVNKTFSKLSKKNCICR